MIGTQDIVFYVVTAFAIGLLLALIDDCVRTAIREELARSATLEVKGVPHARTNSTASTVS